MSPFKLNLFYLLVLNVILAIYSLVELPTAENNVIAPTEFLIRKTVNGLFSILNLKEVKHKARLKHFVTIHNYFVSLTLKDHDNLNEIFRLSREKPDDNTYVLTATLNETLNEALTEALIEDNSNESKDATITAHVETFLIKLRNLKQQLNVDNLSEDTIVNEQILGMLSGLNTLKSPNNNTNQRDIILDDIEFWRDSEDARRVYRGHNTKAKYFPFMASVQFFKKFQCGGSIIKSDLVITAASCLQLAYNNRFFRENPAFLSVRVGSNFYEGDGEDISVLEIYFHPTYDPKTLRNNLALMRLLRRLNFQKGEKKVKKIDFDREASSLPVTTDGITIVGWGAKGTSNILDDPWNNRLSFAVLDYYPLSDCREMYSKEYVTRTNFCAGFITKGGGACNCDVGGPGIVGGLLTGVVSFGSPVCGAPDAPTVFTKVGYYADWIEEIMDMEVPQCDRRTTLKPQPTIATPAPYYALKPTTFKMEPIAGKMKPIPIEPSALRIFEESDLFAKFLGTMFTSSEIKEYTDLLDSARQEVEEAHEILEKEGNIMTMTATTVAPTTAVVEPGRTQLNIYDASQEATSQTPKKYTALDGNLQRLATSAEGDLEKDIVELFKNIEGNELLVDPNDNNTFVPKNNINIDNFQKNDDSVLTFLYLTDNEKNKVDVERESSESAQSKESDGMSIPPDTFLDMTYRNNASGKDSFDLMPQNDLFSLLSEVINADINKNDTNITVFN